MDTTIPVAYAVKSPPPPRAPVAESSFRVPPSSPEAISSNADLTSNQSTQLQSQGFTKGLTEAIAQNIIIFPLRYWVVDNSGSMAATDGHRLISTKDQTKVKLVSCTRWKEIQETVEYHAQMAGLLSAPTTFRLLNNPGGTVGPQEFSVADKGEDIVYSDLQIARNTMMKATPGGVTPLADHIHEIKEQISILAPQLISEGRKVAIILATDGLPTNSYGIAGHSENQNFVNALRSLEGMPVWIVVRLCTDDERIVEFYNSLDNQLELSIEVLDDFVGEAEEVYEQNSWLTYSLPMHRMREMGFHNRLFDLLDERPLTRDELRDFCMLLFGTGHFDGVPDPEVDFRGFADAVHKMVKKEKSHWNPVKNKVTPIINMEKLHKKYGDDSCTIM